MLQHDKQLKFQISLQKTGLNIPYHFYYLVYTRGQLIY